MVEPLSYYAYAADIPNMSLVHIRDQEVVGMSVAVCGEPLTLLYPVYASGALVHDACVAEVHRREAARIENQIRKDGLS